MKYIVVVLAVIVTAAFGQGPLNPPAAPAPTMKTLLELWNKLLSIETQGAGIQNTVNTLRNDPRTVITTSPVLIIDPGSYVLGADIKVPSLTAILIATDDVTLDLNGFTVSSSSATPSGHGILITGARRNIHIKNGTIKGATTVIGATFSGAGFANGIFCDAPTCSNIVVSDVRVRSVAERGIDLGSTVTPGLVVERSVVAVCVSNGITAHSVRACDVSDSQDVGIRAAVVNDCSAASIGSAITDSGIVAGDVANSRGSAVGGIGIFANNVHNCSATSTNFNAISALNVSNSRGTSTGGRGIEAFGNATNCYAESTSGAVALDVTGTASFCRGVRPGGTAIQAGIAIGCTSGGGIVGSFQKHLGTP